MPMIVIGRSELPVTADQEDALVDMCDSHGTVIHVCADSDNYWDKALHAAVVDAARKLGVTDKSFKIDMMDF